MEKKLFFLLIAFFALIANLFAQEMTYTNHRDGSGVSIGLTLPSYEVKSLNYQSEEMHKITLSGIFLPNDEGMPDLPRISRFVAVPKGAEIRVSVRSMETERLNNVNIAPALRIQAIPEEPVTDYVKNTIVYAKNEFYPQNPVEVSEVTDLRGVNCVIIGITPFQFNPVTKELVVINNIDLDIEYIGGTREFSDQRYRSPWFDPILKNAFVNYEALEDIEYTGEGTRGIGCEYLIVIPNRSDFQPYAEQVKEFRTKQGINTKIMRLDEMGVTTTAQLKTFLHNAYKTWSPPPVAVLLMGGHNTNMALGIPAETISHPYSGSCITDNQYADPTGDLLPDMVFGRMSAETPAQLAVLVSKFIEYETQPCMDPNYYKNPITALGWQTERWFQICSEVVGGYWRKKGKTPVRINAIYSGTPGTSWSTATNTSTVVNYFGPSGTNYIPATPSELGGWSGGTAAQVVTAVNNGAFALQHRDHGFEGGWGEPAFQTSNISQLNNVGKMTYVFTINCLTGKFNHTSPCFGEVFHRYTYNGQNAGAVGFLGPTEVSYSFVNDVFAWGMYDQFDPTFLPSYGPMGNHSSNYTGNWMPAFGNVAGKYFLAQSSWPYNTGDKSITYQMFTAHSDVFLRLFTEVPQTITANHAAVTLAGNTSFSISANAGTLIALTAMINGQREILCKAVATGGTQTLTIPSTLIPTTQINVVITGQNYKRYESIVTVLAAAGPYIIPIDYTVVNENKLTYISNNSEISILLKNVGIEATGALNVSITSNDPQLTITNNMATCAGIAPNEIKAANFNVNVSNNIPDGKIFSITVTAVENGTTKTWVNNMSLQASAPKLSLQKVLINDVVDGNLPKGSLVKITAVVENKGGAGAINVMGALAISNPYITLACAGQNPPPVNMPAGATVSFDFYIVTSANMPFGHTANFNLSLSAMYGISQNQVFTASCSGANSYCEPGATNCSSYNDRFTSVILVKTSAPSVYLINHAPTCSSNGYTNYTNINVPLTPGEQYTIKVKTGYANHNVRGWFDLNGNNFFDNNEMIVSLTCPTVNTEYSQTFTIPQDVTPGTYRFRLRTKDSTPVPEPCNAYSWGQTLDYTITLPELNPRVQNVVAVKTGGNITITWVKPATGTPTGYNIYRNGNRLNTTPLTNLTFTEGNITTGIYVYDVKAVYTGNKESIGVMSNVICSTSSPQFCEAPVILSGTPNENSAVIIWKAPVNIDGTLLKYNIYRNGIKINEVLPAVLQYNDPNLNLGTYIYQVSASYAHCPESILSNSVTVTITCIPQTTKVTASICQGSSYNFYGQILTTAGVYTHDLGNCNKVELTLTVNPTFITPITATINQGQTYNFFGQQLTQAGIYTHTLQTIHSCDSTIRLTLNVNKIFTITATAGQGGTITPSGTVNVVQGTNATFTFTPATGYKIASIIVNGVTQSNTNSTYTFSNVQANHTIQVNFVSTMLTITATAGTGGTITPSGTVLVAPGGTATFTFTPNTGYKIADVLIDGKSDNKAIKDGFITIKNINKNYTVHVTFVSTMLTVTATAGPNGIITPSGVITVAQGGTVTLTFTPNSGYKIQEVLVNGKSDNKALKDGFITIKNITANQTVHVTFSSQSANPPLVIGELEQKDVLVYGHLNTVYIKNQNNVELDAVEILDLLGRTVYQGAITDKETVITLNVPTAIYIVKIKYRKDNTTIHKVSLLN